MKKIGGLPVYVAMAALFAAFFWVGLALSLPSPPAKLMPGRFDARAAQSRLAAILGDQRPHPVDTTANDDVRARLLGEIEKLGYRPQVDDAFVCRSSPRWPSAECARVKNVSFQAGPAEGPTLLVAAHYDSVPAGPGASDDGFGVAALLEIAAQLKQEKLKRPLLFLFTDGEEAGLIGAHAFVAHDPRFKTVTDVVNVEARGVSGGAMMFQTSAPNGRDLAAFAPGAARPFANSVMTDVYRLLPNDTDFTDLVKGQADGLNFAIIGDLPFYHSVQDDLAHFSVASLQNVGDNALNAVRNFEGGAAKSDANVAFTDILSRAFLVLPQAAALALIAFGALAAGIGFALSGPDAPWRSAAFPIVSIVTAFAAAFAAHHAIALRPETVPWAAHPEAMRAMTIFAALLAVMLTSALFARTATPRRLVHAAWFVFALIGFALSTFLPGAAILFAPALAVYAVSAALVFWKPTLWRGAFGVAAIAAVVALAPLCALLEAALGYGVAGAFAVVIAFPAAFTLPLTFDDRSHERRFWPPAIVAAAGFSCAVAAAFLVPAYSRAAPEQLNIGRVDDADGHGFFAARTRGGALPPELQRAAKWEKRPIEGLWGIPYVTPAPAKSGADAPDIHVLSDALEGEARVMRVLLDMHGADAVAVRIPKSAQAFALVDPSGAESGLKQGDDAWISCRGRACDGASLTLKLKSKTPQAWLAVGARFGLPADAEALAKARPPSALPNQDGDTSISIRRLEL